MLNPPKIVHMPTLIKVAMSDHPVIQNMACFYVYDMPRHCGNLPGWECPDDGLNKQLGRLRPSFCAGTKQFFPKHSKCEL